MDQDEAARTFLAKVHSLVSDYHRMPAPQAALSGAIRHMWAEERQRRGGAVFARAKIREIAGRQFSDIEQSWPMEKPPSVQMLQDALLDVLDLCDGDSTSTATRN